MPPAGATEQEWLDQVMSQLMASYEPPAQATAARVRNALPRMKVRAASSAGEPGEGEACVRAGEPCAVCQDNLVEGAEVLELPCSHVSCLSLGAAAWVACCASITTREDCR
jgi:hypothetical protein